MFRHSDSVTVFASDRWWALGSSNCLCEWEHFPLMFDTKFTFLFSLVFLSSSSFLFSLVFLSPSSHFFFPGVSFTKFTFLFSLVKNVFYQIHIFSFLGVSFTKFTSRPTLTLLVTDKKTVWVERRQPKCWWQAIGENCTHHRHTFTVQGNRLPSRECLCLGKEGR